MCGIGGFFGQTGMPSEVQMAALQALRKRGPDAERILHFDVQGRAAGMDSPNFLIHTRLAIRDPRPVADQPMSSADGLIWICYNGEVYGWQEDAQYLKNKGVQFNTTSDTEFILHAYEHWGWDVMLQKLRGMFALVIIDFRQQLVWLARDRLGLKPLLYSFIHGQLAFGSLVRSVLPLLPSKDRQFSSLAIDAYLAHRTIPAPLTIFTHIQRLENGHYLQFDLRTRQLRKTIYWTPQPSHDNNLSALLDESIRLRTVADRPLGLYLSSGIDSSVIAERLSALGYTNLAAFTAQFADPSMDESQLASAWAQRLGLPQHIVPVPLSIADDFSQIVADLDEPFADPSSFPTWYLSRATSQHVKVILGGDGGDELFAGYKRYAKHMRTKFLPVRHAAWRPSAHLFPSKRDKLKLEMSLDWQTAYMLRFSGFNPLERAALLSTALPQLHYWRACPEAKTAPHIKTLLHIDYANYLPEYILRKADLMTMAHGLEGRCPLLDHHWVAAVLAQPDKLRFSQPPKRLLLEQTGMAVDDWLYRNKRGFSPPLQEWVERDLASRYHELGQRLERLTNGLLKAVAVETFCHVGQRQSSCYENILQLLILDESLSQLHTLMHEAMH